MRERYLLNGASGFLGSAIHKQLEQSGHEVVRGGRDGNDDLSSVQYVIYCQAYGNYYDQTDPYQIYEANTGTLAKILSVARLLRGLVYVSSSSVLLPHETFYSASKAVGETLVYLSARDKQVLGVSARPASITGVGEQPEHLIPKLIDSCLKGTEMPFVGEPTHDFIDVSDVAKAVIFLVERAGELAGQSINISSGKTVSNEEVLAIVEAHTGRRANLKRTTGLRSYDTGDWRVDNTALVEMGWKPEVTLEESIKRMIHAHPNLPSSKFIELDRKYGH